MIKINSKISLPESELDFSFIRSPGPGGQNVNKVATAAELRFKVEHSTLPEALKARLKVVANNKINQEGELIIKATQYRTQERNKHDAIKRLVDLIKAASFVPKKRKKTKPSYSSVQERLTKKKLQGHIKSLRGKKSIRMDD